MATLPAALVRDIADKLSVLGLDRRQATLYVHLVSLGPLRASEAASALRMHRTDAYRHLQILIRQGLVTASLARPTTYSAIPPERAWSDALASHAAQGEALRDARAETLALFGTLQPVSGGGQPRLTHRIIHGRPAIYGMVESMLRSAKRSQWLVSTVFAGVNATPSNAPYQATIQRAREGIAMKLLFVESPGIHERIAPLLVAPQIEIRFYRPSSHLRFSIVDQQEIAYWLASDPSSELDAKGDVAMWTNAPDFVRAQSQLFETLWERGSPAPS